MGKAKPQVQSPCIHICSLNEGNVCTGCYRTGEEISLWGSMDEASQLAVMRKVREREAKSPFVSN
ncbi:DUF1289 domain-containing protein [Marinomonas sp. GJ51-6]|uniref:DUF1289 domain-containing protein n=1 Tax=Marinomonas sp. GJ51-6 TaxID=2992802 RepID=UPI002935233D|nr:DUF1289 domain-containing protein [Marinomonas sp. GJ51-6]WOD06925.1 DUF1289 domain-containing protein [Marinomonas sp. GJ51-6]